MAKRHSPTKVDLLPPTIRETVGRLLAANHTIDEVVEHLRQLEATGAVFDMPSRSGVGRYAERLRSAQKRMADTLSIAEALAPQFGEQPDDRTGRMAAEMVKAGIFDLLTAVEIDEETGRATGVNISAKDAAMLAGALRDLANRDKVDQERTLKLKEQTAKEAAAAVDKVATAEGWGAETKKRLWDAVIGVAK